MKKYEVFLVSGEDTSTIVEVNEENGESIDTIISDLIDCGYTPTYNEIE